MSGTRLGATPRDDGGCDFVVWAPNAESVEVEIFAPTRARHRLAPQPRGYHSGTVPDVGAGARYLLRLDGEAGLPDPASYSQPDGVEAASAVVDRRHRFRASGWKGPSPEGLVIYELHVGTFSPEGTFDAVAARLPELRELGVTAIELMPIASFPGTRNWGYDGVLPFAVQQSYGGLRGLQRLADACHAQSLALLVDVVHNHLGPEGNHLARFGPYFTDAYRTPWGPALNFDRAQSDEVRRYFIEHALFLVEDCAVDGLRLDAVHAIHDERALPFLEELTDAVHEAGARAGRQVLVIAESDRNDPRYVRPRSEGGLGMDGVWCDDLHHALHVALTGEQDGYYADYGELALLATAWAEGIAFRGQWSQVRQRRHGRSPAGTPPSKYVVAAQNHDQVGNRMLGERLAALVPHEALRLAAATVLTSPCTPLLFMGEEHGERRPFLYFTDHRGPELAEAVRKGRSSEFAAFDWRGEVPDPQAEDSFARSVLGTPDAAGRALRACYRELIALRRTLPPGPAQATLAGRVVHGLRGSGDESVHVLLHFGAQPCRVELTAPHDLHRLFDSAPANSRVPAVLPAAPAGAVELLPWQAVVLGA